MPITNNLIHQRENPFSDEYHKKCIDLYLQSGDEDDYIKKIKPSGQFNRYFTREFAIGENEYINFKIDGKVWMSLTPSELESHWVPICTAVACGGHIGIGGLGMGHIVLNIMGDDRIDKITVYEHNQAVIDWWSNRFSDWEGFDKIEFVCGDVREELRKIDKETFSFFYMDIYRDLLPDLCADDALEFMKITKHYFFWGIEKVILDIVFYRKTNNTNTFRTVSENYNTFNPYIVSLFRQFGSIENDNFYDIGAYGYNTVMFKAMRKLIKESKCPFDERVFFGLMGDDYEA